MRDEVAIIAPQEELLTLWSRQEDWDEARRLSCASAWWMTGPESTTRWEYRGAVPPSYAWAHMGTEQPQPYAPGVVDATNFANDASPPVADHVFASREDDGYVQLWPSRVEEDGTLYDDRVIHFDHETRDPEGRYLPDEIVQKPANDPQIAWSVTPVSNPDGALLRALSFSAWIKPRAIADGTLLDVGYSSPDSDRVTLLFEQQDLVLRVLDGLGNHVDTTFNEASELRFAIGQGTSPGIPIDRWTHVAVDVRGSRPDQMSMLVNGLAHGVRTLGLTRLTAAAPQTAGTLAVESTEGFPRYCTVRIGNELIEVETQGQTAFAAQHYTTGVFAGFGGRQAREEYDKTPTGPPVGTAANVAVPLQFANPNYETDHPAGATVELYGYSLPIATNVHPGEAAMAVALGPYRAAVLDTVEGSGPTGGDPITNENLPLGSFGLGMEGEDSEVNALVLASADDPGLPWGDYMPAFNPDGGYAAIVQYAWSYYGSNVTANGTPIGGIEIIRYSGWNENTLFIATDTSGRLLRGDAITELPYASGSTAPNSAIGGRRAFIADWNTNWNADGAPIHTLLDWRTYVVPISLSVPGAAAADFPIPPATGGESRFAQITRLGNETELTEWVRYDKFEITRQPAQLVRSELTAMGQLYYALTLKSAGTIGTVDPPQPGGGGGPGGPIEHTVTPSESAANAKLGAAPAPTQSYTSQWSPLLGVNENADFPISAAAESKFQFRGVFGTYSHAHVAGTTIVPVFSTYGEGINGVEEGRPGRMDAAFLVDPSVQSLGFPVRVHRAHIPSATLDTVTWLPAGPLPQPGPVENVTQDVVDLDKIYVALQARAPTPLQAGQPIAPGQPLTYDTRATPRLTCFPSGERPRVVDQVRVGGAIQGAGSGAVPSAVIDEIVFGDAQFGTGTGFGQFDDLQGACLMLAADMTESAQSLSVYPRSVRVPGYDVLVTNRFFLDPPFPTDAGLLRIGDEILAFNSRDPASGNIGVATNGRGLLGTTPQHHHTSEPVPWLESHVVTFLSGDISAEAAELPVADLRDFPSEGTILIGSELIHYTRRRGNSLEMPRASTVAGAMDDKGAGLFRGRFGTLPAPHTAGEAVILFPFRYWDRWAPKADAPELAYFGVSVDQPAGLLSSCFFYKSDGEASQIGVLQRTDPDAPWDADPETDPRLKLYWKGDDEGQPLAVHAQSDRVDWRIFVQYSPNAFDLATGMSHGWKESPRLTRFGAFHYAPNLVLRSVER